MNRTVNKVNFFLLARCLCNKQIMHGFLEIWNLSSHVQLGVLILSWTVEENSISPFTHLLFSLCNWAHAQKFSQRRNGMEILVRVTGCRIKEVHGRPPKEGEWYHGATNYGETRALARLGRLAKQGQWGKILPFVIGSYSRSAEYVHWMQSQERLKPDELELWGSKVAFVRMGKTHHG